MAEFQGSFLSFIKTAPKETKNYRKPVPVPKKRPIDVINLDGDSNSDDPEVVADTQGDEEIIETGLYEVVAEKDIESSEASQSVVMASVKKLVESREETYRRLESELENLTRACKDDFMFQVTDEEYDALFKHKVAYFNELKHQVLRWCSKNLKMYRVCGECGFKVTFTKAMREHIKRSGVCATYYYALGTSAFPSNMMQCRECDYLSNVGFNMKRHQMVKGHKGIDKISKDGVFVEYDGELQAEPVQKELEQEALEIQEDEELQKEEEFKVEEELQIEEELQTEEEVQAEEETQTEEEVKTEDVIVQDQVQAKEPEEVPIASSSTDINSILNNISMWPKDDDSGGIISNLQSRLEEQVENSDDHFIFRISHEEYAALSERRTYHMAKFGELVNIYCNKTLKLYQVCDGCGFATFLRKDMIKHFETGSCVLSYFNALGTCDDDDPNKDAVEEESVQFTPIEDQFHATKVEATAIEVEPTEIEPAVVEQPKLPTPEINFQCPHCNSEMSIRNKPRHLKRHCPVLLGKTSTAKHPIPDNKQCPHCTRSFQTIIRLNHHIRIVHSEKHIRERPVSTQIRKEFKCETCPKQFKFSYLLKKHTLRGCSVIKKKLKQQKAAKRAREPFVAAPIQCKDCLIFFISTADLFRHQKNYCKAHHMRTAALESVIKVEPTSLGGGSGQG